MEYINIRLVNRRKIGLGNSDNTVSIKIVEPKVETHSRKFIARFGSETLKQAGLKAGDRVDVYLGKDVPAIMFKKSTNGWKLTPYSVRKGEYMDAINNDAKVSCSVSFSFGDLENMPKCKIPAFKSVPHDKFNIKEEAIEIDLRFLNC